MGIRFCVSPKRELGRSMTIRGGESSKWISGITGLLERISTAGTPCSWTMRTLVTRGGGPKVWAATLAASSAAIIPHTDLSAGRGKESLIGSLKETYRLQGWGASDLLGRKISRFQGFEGFRVSRSLYHGKPKPFRSWSVRALKP